MKSALRAFEAELEAIRAAGTWREERIITTPSAPASTPPKSAAWSISAPTIIWDSPTTPI